MLASMIQIQRVVVTTPKSYGAVAGQSKILVGRQRTARACVAKCFDKRARALQRLPSVNEWFHRFSQHAAKVLGSSRAFVVALLVVVAWLASGPVFHYSDSWQLIINTGTTIVTFLMVFVIQNSQNRDTMALQLKIDELIRATKGARNSMIDLARLNDQQLAALEREYLELTSVSREGSPPHRGRADRRPH